MNHFDHIAWRAVPIAGTAAAIVFLLTVLVLMPLVIEVNASLFLLYAASLVMGDAVLVDPGALTALVGIIVHLVLSLVMTLVIAFVVHRWGMLVGVVGGAVLGLSFYAINFYAVTVLFPYFFAINNWVLVVAHVLFGVVAGGVYERLDTFDQPLLPDEGGQTA